MDLERGGWGCCHVAEQGVLAKGDVRGGGSGKVFLSHKAAQHLITHGRVLFDFSGQVAEPGQQGPHDPGGTAEGAAGQTGPHVLHEVQWVKE